MNRNPIKTESEYTKRHSKGQFYTDVNLMPLVFKLFKLITTFFILMFAKIII